MAIELTCNAPVTNDELNELRAAAWPDQTPCDWTPMFQRAFGWVTARDDGRLVGFVRLLWDGDVHVFLLDATVHPDYGRRGIGADVVKAAVRLADASGAEWLHVDYEPHLEAFYAGAGFRPTPAGLIRLGENS